MGTLLLLLLLRLTGLLPRGRTTKGLFLATVSQVHSDVLTRNLDTYGLNCFRLKVKA